MTRAEKLVAAVRKKGSDARDARDAAHEACHALQWGLRGKWTRERIDKKNPNKARHRASWAVSDEILARAVEALVCKELGLEYDQDKWILMMVMETLKLDGIALPSFEWVKNAIVSRMKGGAAVAMVERVLALAD